MDIIIYILWLQDKLVLEDRLQSITVYTLFVVGFLYLVTTHLHEYSQMWYTPNWYMRFLNMGTTGLCALVAEIIDQILDCLSLPCSYKAT